MADRRFLVVLTAVLLASMCELWASPACAHPVTASTAITTVWRDGTVQLTVRCDVLAFALGDVPQRVDDQRMMALLEGPRAELEQALIAGKDRFLSGTQLTVGGAGVPLSIVDAPTVEKIEQWKASGATPLLPVKMEFVAKAELPKGSSLLTLMFPEALGDVVLTVQTPGEEPLAAMVSPGSRSDEYSFNLDAPRVPGTVSPGAERSRTPAPAGAPEPAPANSPPAEAKVGSAHGALSFVLMGVWHILPGPEWFKESWEIVRRGQLLSRFRDLAPDGSDHILFVLGLFFLSPRLRPLLIQITCFTVAHSVTLALCARGVIRLPASIVEPTIAASIAFVAVENVFTQRVHAWRPLVVFGFGLVHGLGFASAFAEAVGSERSPLGPVLLFNCGVEIGQLAAVGAALLTVGWFRDKPWYRNRIAIPASIAIACVAIYWVVTRIMGAP